MKMKLERGDPCFVRLKNGKVAQAKYIEPVVHAEKCHRVCVDFHKYSGVLRHHITVGNYPLINDVARFQYPLAEMKKQMGLQ